MHIVTGNGLLDGEYISMLAGLILDLCQHLLPVCQMVQRNLPRRLTKHCSRACRVCDCSGSWPARHSPYQQHPLHSKFTRSKRPALCVQVKNVTGRLLVGLRWWNEGNSETGEAWRFESLAEVSSWRRWGRAMSSSQHCCVMHGSLMLLPVTLVHS